ncbi:unnamed protein product [Ascophyllum nodosum]
MSFDQLAPIEEDEDAIMSQGQDNRRMYDHPNIHFVTLVQLQYVFGTQFICH